MEYTKVCIVFCSLALLHCFTGVVRASEQAAAPPASPAPLVADLLTAGETAQADVAPEATRKVRQYFGPAPPPYFGAPLPPPPPPPPYYGGGGGFGGFGGGYGGYGFGGGFQRTRVVTRTRYRGGFGGFGGGYYG